MVFLVELIVQNGHARGCKVWDFAKADFLSVSECEAFGFFW